MFYFEVQAAAGKAEAAECIGKFREFGAVREMTQKQVKHGSIQMR